MTGTSIRLTKQRRWLPSRQLAYTAFCWLYVLFCFGAAIFCLSIAIPETLTFGTYGSLIFSLSLLLAFTYAFASYLILSPPIMRTITMMRERRFYQAEKMMSRSINIVRRLGLRKDWSYCTAVSNLAVLKVATGQFAEAELMYDELVQYIKKDKRLAKSCLAAIYLNNLAYAHLRQDELEAAEINALKAKTIWSNLKPKQRSGTAFPLVNLAEIDLYRDNLAASEAKLDQALALIDEQTKPIELMEESFVNLKITAYILKATIYLQTDRKANADALTKLALEHMNGEDCYTGFCINTVTNLASAYLEQGDKQLAEALLEHAYDHARAFPTHPDNVHLLDCYEQLLAGSERAHELPDLKAWVRPIHIGEDPAE